jgi:hypothetical protein
VDHDSVRRIDIHRLGNFTNRRAKPAPRRHSLDCIENHSLSRCQLLLLLHHTIPRDKRRTIVNSITPQTIQTQTNNQAVQNTAAQTDIINKTSVRTSSIRGRQFADLESSVPARLA